MQQYTIQETAKLSGLPKSTLRYYETIGLIHPIQRDASSKHRVYSEDDLNRIISIGCLNATGLSIEDMRIYLKNRNLGIQAANEQITLLSTQKKRLIEEVQFIQLRQQYIDVKMSYWKAVATNDIEKINTAKKKADVLSKKLREAVRIHSEVSEV